jgi:hypothetical protein
VAFKAETPSTGRWWWWWGRGRSRMMCSTHLVPGNVFPHNHPTKLYSCKATTSFRHPNNSLMKMSLAPLLLF